MKFLQKFLFFTMIRTFFHDLPELRRLIHFRHPETEEHVKLGRDLFGELIQSGGIFGMNQMVRNRFLTILFYRPLLRRLIGNFHTRNRMIAARILAHIVDLLLAPVVTSKSLLFYTPTNQIIEISKMRILVNQPLVTTRWVKYSDNFHISFFSPFNYKIDGRIEILSRSYLIEFKEISSKEFISWALLAKILMDIEDRKMFSFYPMYPTLSIIQFIDSMSDSEILNLFASHEFSTIFRKYIIFFTKQQQLRDIEAVKIRSNQIVLDILDSAMILINIRAKEKRQMMFEEGVIQFFLEILCSERLKMEEIQEDQTFFQQIKPKEKPIQDIFDIPLVRINQLKNILSGLLKNHSLGIDLNELTFLVIWTANFNVELGRQLLVKERKPWLRSSWRSKRVMNSGSPVMILFFAVKYDGQLLKNILSWFSYQN